METELSLTYGVEFNGVLHYEAVIRLPMVAQSRAAIAETVERFGTIEGSEAQQFYAVALNARSIVSLGDIPPDEITGALIDEQMVDDDYSALHSKVESLRKKRAREKARLQATASRPSPSEDTESQKTASTE